MARASSADSRGQNHGHVGSASGSGPTLAEEEGAGAAAAPVVAGGRRPWLGKGLLLPLRAGWLAASHGQGCRGKGAVGVAVAEGDVVGVGVLLSSSAAAGAGAVAVPVLPEGHHGAGPLVALFSHEGVGGSRCCA